MITKEQAAENVLLRAEARQLLNLSTQAFQYRKNLKGGKNAIKSLKTVHPSRNSSRTIDLYWKPDLLRTDDYSLLEKEDAARNVLLRAEAEELLDVTPSLFTHFSKRIPVLKTVKPEGNTSRYITLYWKPDVEQFQQAQNYYQSPKD